MSGPGRHVIRRNAFRFARPALLWGRALLYEDRIELRGWNLSGRYRRVIDLRDIEHVDVLTSDAVGLWCSGGETLRLRLEDAAEWKRCLLRQQALLDARHRRPPEGRADAPAHPT